jgi:DNA (cytosine-5)-methyltransferase 1
MSARYEALKSRESMFSVEASPARTSVRLDVVPGFSASAADYGLSSPVSLGDVLGDLADDGYDAEWDGIPAAAVGAPHLRARLWILAYPRGVREQADDTVCAGRALAGFHPGWDAEPAVARVADGLPGRVDVGALGNAVVPHIPELIGRRIIDYERNGG